MSAQNYTLSRAHHLFCALKSFVVNILPHINKCPTLNTTPLPLNEGT